MAKNSYKRSARKGRLSFFKNVNSRRSQLLLVMLVFTLVGGYFIYRSFADTGKIKVNAPAVSIISAGKDNAYWVVTNDGGVFSMNATFHGSMGGKRLSQPITDAAVRNGYAGYWLLGGDGGVFAFGSAQSYGTPSLTTTQNYYRAIVPTATGNGYWVIGNQGHIHAFGDAKTTYAAKINESITKYNTAYGGLPNSGGGIVAAARSASNYGLVLLGADGSVFAYGDMPYRGGANGKFNYSSGVRAVDIRMAPDNNYTITTSDGGVYNFGSSYLGGANKYAPLGGKIVGMAYSPNSTGYWQLGEDGGIFAFGTAKYGGSVFAPTTKSCPDGSTILSTATCPPTTKTCPDGKTYLTTQTCPKASTTQTGSGGGTSGGSLSADGGRGGFTPVPFTEGAALNGNAGVTTSKVFGYTGFRQEANNVNYTQGGCVGKCGDYVVQLCVRVYASKSTTLRLTSHYRKNNMLQQSDVSPASKTFTVRASGPVSSYTDKSRIGEAYCLDNFTMRYTANPPSSTTRAYGAIFTVGDGAIITSAFHRGDREPAYIESAIGGITSVEGLK